MNLRLCVCALCFALLSGNSSFAQPKETFGERLYFGGNFGLQFGNQTIVDVSPLAGYKITDEFSAGITATYIYYKFKDPNRYYPDYSTNIYGGSIFSRYLFLENIFAHAELQFLNMEVGDVYSYGGTYYQRIYRKTIPNCFLGGGYIQRFGDQASFIIMLLYDVIDDRHSPYQNPVLRIGFGYGF